MLYLLNFLVLITQLTFQSKSVDNENLITTTHIDTALNSVIFQIDDIAKGNSKINLNFYYHDAYAYGNPILITSKGATLTLKEPTFFFMADDKQTPFLIYPNEKINIKYAGTDSVKLYVAGNLSRTNELNFFRKLVQETGNVYQAFMVMPYQKKVVTLNNFYQSQIKINDLKKERLEFLKKYNNRTPTSKSFNLIAINSIQCIAFQDSLILLNNNKTLLTQHNLYVKSLNAKLNSIKKIDFLPFQFNYNMYSTLFSLLTVNSLSTVINDENTFVKKFNFIEKNSSGKTRIFLLSNIMNMATQSIVKIPANYVNKFKMLYASENNLNLLLNKIEDNLKFYKTDNTIQANSNDIQNLNFIISKYEGKIILLDFWASWCVPCRVELPYSKNLSKSYLEKDIVFIYISIDKKKENWINASNDEQLEKNNSYLLLDPDNSPFIKKYNLFSIPRYMLIGRDGKILNDNAPRSSDIKLKSLIDMNL
jgi:thiol-disulfide isomerase/thioredoxin